MSTPFPAYDPTPKRRYPWVQAGAWSIGFVALLWAIEVLDTFLFGNDLDLQGVRPGVSDGLLGVLFAPFLHAGWEHLASNSGPLLVLGFLILLSGVGRWIAVSLVVAVVSGVGTWIFGGVGTVHIGASGLVFGYLVYLVVRGIFNRKPWQIVVGVVVFLFYGSLLWGVLPGTPGVSWQGHFFGAVGGLLAAWWLEEPDRTPRRWRLR